MKRLALLLTAVLLMVAAPTFAQQEAGDSELQLQGTLSIGLKDEVTDSGSIALNYGRFFTERQELGLTAFAVVIGDGDLAGYGGPFYRYNFSTGKTVPYVGASAATSFGDFSAGSILLSFEGGVRWYLDRNIAFTLAGTTNYDTEESEFADQLQVLFGFSYIWGK